MTLRKIGESSAFKVTTYKYDHQCIEKHKQQKDKYASLKYIADKIKETFKDNEINQ